MPRGIAVATARSTHGAGSSDYSTCTFAELNADADALARGLLEIGVGPATRVVLLVPPSVEFVKLVFALLRSGATTVLVDPGMGRKHLVNCLAAAEPDGFVAVSIAQMLRTMRRRRFPRARLNVTIGRRWFWGGATYGQLLAQGRASNATLPTTQADDAAAIIFTSGSTGPPKGVLYTHQMFETQVADIQYEFNLIPAGVDLACFALFGLFNAAWGVTTVFPDMNFSRPASADPRKLLAAANDWSATQAFASPAVWDNLSRHCERSGDSIPTLRNIFSCGAPVPAAVLRRTLDHVAAPGAQMHTPYGATEALPIATIEAQEVLSETADQTAQGAGVCVGRKFDSIDWRIIRITDDPIANINDTEVLPPGEIGELLVQGPQVSPSYSISPAPRAGRLSDQSEVPPRSALANALAKIPDRATVWHRTGDVGYLDDEDRFWYCGRKSHRVETRDGTLFTECVEAVFNQHPDVRRSALVGIGPAAERIPAVVVESSQPRLAGKSLDQLTQQKDFFAWEQLVTELIKTAAARPQTRPIRTILLYGAFPVDVRHNAKINREALAAWADDETQGATLRPHRYPII